MEVELFFVCFDEQSLDLCELVADAVVLAVKGPGLSGKFVKQEVSLEKRVELLVLAVNFLKKAGSLVGGSCGFIEAGAGEFGQGSRRCRNHWWWSFDFDRLMGHCRFCGFGGGGGGGIG